MTDELQKLAEKTEGQMYHSQDVDARRHNVGIILTVMHEAVVHYEERRAPDPIHITGDDATNAVMGVDKRIAELERELAGVVGADMNLHRITTNLGEPYPVVVQCYTTGLGAKTLREALDAARAKEADDDS